MNINLVYEGKSHNFDIQKGATIDYLKELSSKIFQSNKELLDIIYNNEKLQNCDSNTLLKDLIPEGETNAILTVQKNKNMKCLDSTKQMIPLTPENSDSINDKKTNDNIDKKIEKRKDTNTSTNKINNKNIIFDNKNFNIKVNSNNIIKNSIVFNYKDKKFDKNINSNLNKNHYDTKAFVVNYYRKYNELLSLMKNFNEKMNHIHIMLIKKFKNSDSANSTNNTNENSSFNNHFFELALYEKKIIDFEDKQIQYYKTLLNILSKNSNNAENLKLREFYNTLIFYDIKKNHNNNNINKIGLNSNLELSGESEIVKFPLKLKKVSSNSILTKNNNLSTYSKLPIIKKSSSVVDITKRLDESQTITNKKNKLISLQTNNEILNNSILKKKKIEDTNINNQINNIIIKDDSKVNKSILSSEKNSTKNIIKAESSKFFKNISDNNLEKISNEDIVSVGSRKMSPKRKILISKKKNLISDILSDELNNTKKKNEKIVDFPNELNNSRTKKETMKIIDVSGMTINDSNFNRDKQSNSKKKRRKSMNRFDYII